MLAVLRPREGGLRRGENFWLRPTTGSAQCLRLSQRLFIIHVATADQYCHACAVQQWLHHPTACVKASDEYCERL